MIFDSDLYDRVLIEPGQSNPVDKLTIVSGYATASMLSRHYDDLNLIDFFPRIDLVIGMTPSDGISVIQHKAFKKLQESKNRISCRYLIGNYSVHSKVYVWSRKNQPVIAYAGSANYTQSGFLRGDRIETMARVDPNSALSFCQRIRRKTLLCLSDAIDKSIALHVPKGTLSKSIVRANRLESVVLPLIEKKSGETPAKSGLNWGQRPQREPNQAYIPIPSRIYKSGFFPPIGDFFVTQTDDGETLILARAQERGKALHTPHDNSIIGRYFRRRLGVPIGERVHRSHLDKYGRTDVKITKTDDETYFLDFSN